MKRVVSRFAKRTRALARKGRTRLWLGVTLAGLGLGDAACGSGDFDSATQVTSLRALAGRKDHPYTAPGTDVTIDLLWTDGNPKNDAAPPNVDVRWIPGCINPLGDLYYSCYSQFAVGGSGVPGAGASAGDAAVEPRALLALLPKGDRLTVSIPPDIISRRPPPTDPTIVPYGLAVEFFVLCDGHLDLAAPGSEFPLDCFDDQHNSVGADRFVPGYATIYVYADPATSADVVAHPERYPTNTNPIMTALDIEDANPITDIEAGALSDASTIEAGIALDAGGSGDASTMGGSMGDAVGGTGPVVSVDRCTAENRDDCPVHRLTPSIDPASAEIDVLDKGQDGTFLREELWIDYYATGGDVSRGVRLVNDATTGWNADQWAEWKAPATSGTIKIWGVLHDNRGGVAWVERDVIVR